MNLVDSAELRLDPEPTSVSRARRWLSRQLEAWGLEDLDYDMSVVLSELVTNAVLYARTQITVTVKRNANVRLEVADASPVLPNLREYGAENTTGRGLHLVSALASAWGCDRLDDGKTVWAEFPQAAGGSGSGSSESAQHPPSEISPLRPKSGSSKGPLLKKTA
jgi:anti-sigma regulatory factor (Ser/Thr protein kinase)